MNKFIIIVVLLTLGLITLPIIPDEKVITYEEKLKEIIVVEDKPIINVLFEKIKEFLKKDTTSNKLYDKGYYDCGHFVRDLSINASKENLSIGGIIVGNDPDLQGYSHHAMNYIILNNVFYIINPESDFIVPWNEWIHKDRYEYYKLYPKGALLPTRWKRLDNVHSTNELT